MADSKEKTNEYFLDLAKERISLLIDHDLFTEDDGRRVSFGYIPSSHRIYILEVFLAGELKISNGVPLDNHQDTIRICRVEIDKKTEAAQVTIFNETSWLKRPVVPPLDHEAL